jgi:RHS repeat-associated protein
MAYNTLTTGPVTCPSGDGAGSADVYQDWAVQLADGTVHPLASTVFSYLGATCSSGFTAQTIDGSGYTLSVTGKTVNSIYASNGMNLTSTKITDSNGNSISYASNGSWTDTLGLTTLAPSPPGWAWTDTNGNSQMSAITYTNYDLRSAFGCSGYTDYNETSATAMPTKISFPDSTDLQLAWEATPGYSSDSTGRLTEITLRNGTSTVQFNYNASGAGASGNYGLNCTNLVPNSLSRTTSDGTATYNWASTSTGNTTTKLDIGQNKTVYTFSNGGNATVLTEIQYFLNVGTIASPAYTLNPTTTNTYCYNSGASPTVSSCSTAAVSEPINQLAVFASPNHLSPSESYTTFDNYGNVTYSAQYDFGGTSPLIATTNTMALHGSGNCSGIGATINNKVCSSTTAVLSNTVAASKYAYSATGNLLTTYVSPNGGSTYLSNTTANSYNANGTPSTLYDLANNPTTFGYTASYYTDCGSCTQLPFATSRTKGGLTTYSYYNGYGGVKTEDVDANGNITTYCYNNTTGLSCNGASADPWSRVMAIIDPLNNEVFKTYSVTNLTSDFSFGSGSVNNFATTLDGYGRTINVQKQQGPSSSNYDTVSIYRGFSTVIPTVQTTNPCPEPLGTPCGTTYGPTAGGTAVSNINGAFLESTLTKSGSNATTTTTHFKNWLTSILSPAPSGENTKGTQNQYNGAGWLINSCAISSVVSGEVACGNFTNGILTTITYSSATGSSTVTSSRGPSNQQQRSYTKDGLGRVTSKTTPEGGTWNYYYDTAACKGGAASAGNLTCVKDPNGNVLNYFYDSLNRLTEVNANGSSCRWFYYDNSTGYLGTVPSGYTLTNELGRMVEAATDSCLGTKTSATLITDEWMGDYDKDGRTLVALELTPNSTQYYKSEMTFTGPVLTAVNHLSPSLATFTYGLDGEGRWNALGDGGTTYVPSAGVTYNAAGRPTNVSIGTGTDYDAYTYDNNTLLMTGWTFQVNSIQETANITPNANNTIKSVAITDGFNANGTITYSYNSGLVSGTGYDDLGRLIGWSATGTGGTWSQAFSFDQYDNITKSGTGFTAWNPGYSATTNHYTCSGCTYDANGDVTNDGTNAYTWNAFSKMASVKLNGTGCSTSGDCIIYDAFGRAVEFDDGSTKTEIWYTPIGKHFLNGTTSLYGYEAAPGGGTAFGSSYMHKDWMGNARIISTISSPTVTTDRAFAPYGEVFNVFGGTSQNETMFNGLDQGIFSGMYDTPNREMTAIQGRFMSPDPAGSGWNQYGWPTNPNSFSDPSGLCGKTPPAGCNREGDPDGGTGWTGFLGEGTAEEDWLAAAYEAGAYGAQPAAGTVGADGGSVSATDLGETSTQLAADLTELAGPDAGPDGGADLGQLLFEPAGIQIVGFMFQFDMPNCCDSDGNVVFPDFDGNATMIGNAWYLQVVNEFGWPLAGNFSVTEDVVPVVNESSPNTSLASSQYTWTTNSTGGFVDNIVFGFSSIGPTYFQNIQNFSINGVPANTFYQYYIYGNNGLVVANPWPMSPTGR